MNTLEHSHAVFAHKGYGANDEGFGKLRHQAIERTQCLASVCIIKLPGQCQVEPKLFCDVWVAPLRQKRVLPGRKARRATSLKLTLRGGGPKRIKLGDKAECQIPKQRRVTLWDESYEPSYSCNAKRLQVDRACPVSDGGHGHVKTFGVPSLGQPKRRLERSVKPVLTRCRCPLLKPMDLWARDIARGFDISTKPRSPECGKGLVVREIVDRISLKV